MNDNRTPTTEEVRQVYAYSEGRGWWTIRSLAFGRWLAEHDEETRQKALEELRAVLDRYVQLHGGIEPEDGWRLVRDLRALVEGGDQ